MSRMPARKSGREKIRDTGLPRENEREAGASHDVDDYTEQPDGSGVRAG
jgi:hypothetical protein